MSKTAKRPGVGCPLRLIRDVILMSTAWGLEEAGARAALYPGQGVLYAAGTAGIVHHGGPVPAERLLRVRLPSGNTALLSLESVEAMDDRSCPCGCEGRLDDHDDRSYGPITCPLCREESDADADQPCSFCAREVRS